MTVSRPQHYIEIALRESDIGVLPQPDHFPTVEAWLAALPPYTLLLVTRGEGEFRSTYHELVENLIDGFGISAALEEKWAEIAGSLS